MNEKRLVDTGILFALVFLVAGYRFDPRYLFVSGALLLLALFYSKLLAPLAYVWLKLGETLGFVTNKIFFGLVFFLVVTPIGLLRRMLVKKSDNSSAFTVRDHAWSGEDMAHPY
jgi:hypothetical protein